MVASFSLMENSYWCSSAQFEKKKAKHPKESQTRSPSISAFQEGLLCRRLTVLGSGFSLVSISSLPLKAEEKSGKEEEGDNGVIGAITSLFDPNEKTKSGKVLPKAYVKAAREVVKTLKQSLEEDDKNVAKFRRAADAAKEAIREYLTGWQGKKVVVTEESYAALEKAIRSLANFYSKAGPFAPLPDEVKSNILQYLNTADANI
ncbi:photosystem II D1 precursor processing protein PSB27-H2, chloroplastic [Phalaenopsis equestris]|uniref:photosystem II D1 precursor processing protein PSB27-H2, chloroplastic n=1 Tax=Phalaenopsis equestris TaxID=78828 RepID=UPI0009E510DA|nr:photosystem II D1 precursor processing protein PSB27-H2, chloroplastic [Phalaenopsis equestris]